MKNISLIVIAVVLFFQSAILGKAQSGLPIDNYVMKRRFYDQGAGGTPAAATANPFAFQIQMGGYNVGGLYSNPRANIPGGGFRTPVGSGADFVS